MATRRLLLGAGIGAAAVGLAPRGLFAQGSENPALVLTGAIAPTHDPCIIKEGDTYYLFRTGRGIPWRKSKDLINWEEGGVVTAALPAWATTAIPGSRGAWAPDIAFVNGRFLLYYSVSTFGSNRSAIGLYSNKTLDPAAPGHQWVDEGMVFESSRGDGYNAIDANHVIDLRGRHWLSFGSFWTGLKLFRLDPKTGKALAGDKTLHSIASRPVPAGGANAIEAPFIITRGAWHYLFASYDFCCKGVNSTYYMVVGRSKDIRGPYRGKDGSSMMEGRGSVLLRENSRWRGVGHNAFLREGDKDYLVYHGYDGENNGRQTLRISPVAWTADGWPTVGH